MRIKRHSPLKEEHPANLHPEMSQEDVEPQHECHSRACNCKALDLMQSIEFELDRRRIVPGGFGSDVAGDLPISEYTGQPYDPAWGIQLLAPSVDRRLIGKEHR
jgi:hypothetical protein